MPRSKAWLPPKSLVLYEQAWSVNKDASCGDDGECIPAQCQINIGQHICEEGKGEIWAHELVHALCNLTGMSERLGDEMEETLARSFGPALFATLRRNKLDFS